MKMRQLLLSAATMLGFGAFAMPMMAPHVDYDRRRSRGLGKDDRAAITVSANRGRLTKRGKRGYGLSPCRVSYPEIFLHRAARERAGLFTA